MVSERSDCWARPSLPPLDEKNDKLSECCASSSDGL